MAQTVVKKTVFGDMRVVVVDVNMGAATTHVVAPGIKTVKAFSVGYQSMASVAGVKMSASTSIVEVSAGASGDQFFLTIYGN